MTYSDPDNRTLRFAAVTAMAGDRVLRRSLLRERRTALSASGWAGGDCMGVVGGSHWVMRGHRIRYHVFDHQELITETARRCTDVHISSTGYQPHAVRPDGVGSMDHRIFVSSPVLISIHIGSSVFFWFPRIARCCSIPLHNRHVIRSILHFVDRHHKTAAVNAASTRPSPSPYPILPPLKFRTKAQDLHVYCDP